MRAVGLDYLPSHSSENVPSTANRPAALSTAKASVVTDAFKRRSLVPPQSTSDRRLAAIDRQDGDRLRV